MRIISGKYKNKKIILPKDKLTRPLRDQVKESIFNIILHSNLLKIDLRNSKVLDLFSGSGSFGLECLSRYAKNIVFCENYKPTLNVLKKNIDNLDCWDQIEIIEENIFKVLKENKYFNSKFDIIFLDPPFKEVRVIQLLDDIKKNHLIEKNGIIILHRSSKDKESFSKNTEVIIEKTYGLSKIFFLRI